MLLYSNVNNYDDKSLNNSIFARRNRLEYLFLVSFFRCGVNFKIMSYSRLMKLFITLTPNLDLLTYLTSMSYIS